MSAPGAAPAALPRVVDGVLYVSPAQFAALKTASPDSAGFTGVPTWEAMRRLGLDDADVWNLGHRATKIVVEGAGPIARVLP